MTLEDRTDGALQEFLDWAAIVRTATAAVVDPAVHAVL
jgi:hypothetical protein